MSSLAELRQEQAGDLRTIIGHDGLQVPAEAAADLERDQRFDDEYGRLSERLYTGFVAMAAASGLERLQELAEKPNIQNGSYLVGSVLKWGPKAYGAHVIESGTSSEASVAELGSIMKRSGDIIKLFADCDSQSNHTLELNFGLLQFEPTYEAMPFLINPNDDGELTFQPSQMTLFQSRTEIMGRRLSGDMPRAVDSAARCPAIGRVLTAFWNAGVDICVQEPQLFQAGLEAAIAETPTAV